VSVGLSVSLLLLGNNSIDIFPGNGDLFDMSFSMLSVLYQRKIGDKLLLELLDPREFFGTLRTSVGLALLYSK
jgi:hypothetical protein